MTEYLIASNNDKEEIIDFINYVFSFSHHPHNFKTLLPKAYADDSVDMGAVHYIAKEDGKIKAVVASRLVATFYNRERLTVGFVGNVSVHPYSRGKGYMKELISMAINDACKSGADILALGGQRQRYSYFGFENAGIWTRYNISSANIRHCFNELDCSDISFVPFDEADEKDIAKAKKMYEQRDFYAVRDISEYKNIMKTWNLKSFVVYKGFKAAGYIYGDLSEIVLEDENDMPKILKAAFSAFSFNQVSIPVFPFMNKRMEFLESICEKSSVESVEMINVLNLERTLDVLFKFKASYADMPDGKVEFSVGDESFCMAVENGKASVKKTDIKPGNVISYTNSELLQTLFGINTLVSPPAQFKNYLPLPFCIDVPDTF